MRIEGFRQTLQEAQDELVPKNEAYSRGEKALLAGYIAMRQLEYIAYGSPDFEYGDDKLPKLPEEQEAELDRRWALIRKSPYYQAVNRIRQDASEDARRFREVFSYTSLL